MDSLQLMHASFTGALLEMVSAGLLVPTMPEGWMISPGSFICSAPNLSMAFTNGGPHPPDRVFGDKYLNSALPSASHSILPLSKSN